MIHWQEMNVDERLEVIKLHWDDSISANELAKKISAEADYTVTRSAIIGLYYRNKTKLVEYPLGGNRNKPLTGKAKENAERPRTRKTPPPRPVTTPLPPVAPPIRITELARAYDLTSLDLTLSELGSDQCHWPVNSPPKGEPHLFCGHPVEGGRYCPHHHQRSLPATLRAKKK